MNEPVQVGLEWVSHHRWRAGDALPAHTGAAPAAWLVLDGALDAEASGRSVHAPAGAFCLLPGFVLRRITTQNGAEWLSAGITAAADGADLMAMLSLPRVWTPGADDFPAVCGLMEQMAAECRRFVPFPPTELHAADTDLLRRARQGGAGQAFALLTDALARAVFAACWQAAHHTAPFSAFASGVPAWVTRAARLAREQPRLSVAELAAAVCVSPAHLRRAFRAKLGQSPQECLVRARLDAARRLLLSTERTTEAIAEDVGFNSVSHFSAQFKARFGLPPAAFRRSGGTGHAL